MTFPDAFQSYPLECKVLQLQEPTVGSNVLQSALSLESINIYWITYKIKSYS